jgi:predicted ATP-dependent endonuclease of OLD family
MGSGVFEATYLLTVSTAVSEGIVVLDEPALHLHPIQISALKRVLVENAAETHSQLLSITHSPVFLGRDILKEEVGVTYVNRNDAESTTFQASLEDKQWMISNKEQMHFEFDSSVFFARFVILVEGDSEIGFLEGLSARVSLNLDDQDILVLPVGGKLNFRRILRILHMYSIPFAILADRDALMDITKENMSALIAAVADLFPEETRTLLSSIAIHGFENSKAEPRWLKLCRSAIDSLKLGTPEVVNALDSVSNKHSQTIKRYRENDYKELNDFAVSHNLFVMEEGEIEDLFQKVDPMLLATLQKEFGKRTRLLSRAFVERLSESKLDDLAIGRKLLNAASMSSMIVSASGNASS